MCRICYCLSNAPQSSCKDLWGFNPIQICNHSSPDPFYMNYSNSHAISRGSDCDNRALRFLIYSKSPVLLNIALQFLHTQLVCDGCSTLRMRSGNRHNYLVTYASATNILSPFYFVCFTDYPVSLDWIVYLSMRCRAEDWNSLFSLCVFSNNAWAPTAFTIYLGLSCYRDQSKK